MAFLQTEKPFQVGQEPERAEAKATPLHSIPVYRTFPKYAIGDSSEGCYEPRDWINSQNAGRCDSNQKANNIDSEVSSTLYFLPAVDAVAFAPLWAPHAMLADDFHDSGYFLHFPYDGESDSWLVDFGDDLSRDANCYDLPRRGG
jgi:hypothetical protein